MNISEIKTGDLFNELVRRIDYDGTDFASLTLGEVERAVKGAVLPGPQMDPTSRGDLVAEKVRAWYEANRETWWDRHKPGIIGSGPDRAGTHADEFMLRLIAAVARAGLEVPR